MRDFIDISLSPSDRGQPYLFFLFRNGVLSDVSRHESVAVLAAYCQQFNLPVMAIDPQVRAQLRAYGINAQPPTMRAVGE